ncbi:MAG: flavodoxin family protein [Rhodospirillaceae bacterium]|jgi:multimeric flavodoxin WrbA|nr:flavodoxin family protein [Rhodospirillaceae bacterium]MBT7614631.1 flavodoxin family protein [Rhodospirillaceae bacterium]MBT7645437.1 flavodoxin family protein [Rhodospirillaceae bacterium]
MAQNAERSTGDAASAPKKVLCLSASARPDGNARQMAEALLEGVAQAGHEGELVHLADHVTRLFGNCRECRNAEGFCTLDDGYENILLNKYVKADAVVYVSPIYWYGISGHLKNFLDRFYCYMSGGYPHKDAFIQGMMGKKAALLLSAEENSFSKRTPIVQHMIQLCEYMEHEFVGIAVTTANSRKDVRSDPNKPLDSARELGRLLFDIHETDYRLDTDRGPIIWQGDDSAYKHPAYWR